MTITTGLVDTYSTPTLLRLVVEPDQLDAAQFVTHHFELDQIRRRLRDLRARRPDTRALKVVLTRT